MRTVGRLLFLTMLALFGVAIASPDKAAAGGLYGAATLWLACENGADYPIHPVAISDDGDIVTGYLVLGARQGVHVRLVPMGAGYRYAGRGVWFDGAREIAYLYLSKYQPMACTVVYGPEREVKISG
jgi:hypothetical protein